VLHWYHSWSLKWLYLMFAVDEQTALSMSSPVAKKKKKKREFDPNIAIADADYRVRYRHVAPLR